MTSLDIEDVQDRPSTSAPETGDVQIQPCGFLLELSPDWLILRASENTHGFFGEYHQRMIGEPLSHFTLAQPLHDLRNLLSRQGGGSAIARAYRVRLVDDPRHFDIAFQMTEGRILLEGVPASEDGYGAALGSVARLIDSSPARDRQGLLDGTARRVRALTGFDRVTISLDEGKTAESSRGNFAPRAKPHHIDDLPPIIVDTEATPISLFPAIPGDCAPLRALLRAPNPGFRADLLAQGIRSTIDVPIVIGGEPAGSIECEDRDACEPSFEMHAAVELFAKIFALQLQQA